MLCCLLIISACFFALPAAATYEEQAGILNELGLFRGTDNGYQLEKNFTRAEGATMLVRLLGKEEEALALTEYEHPFEDVRGHWAEAYVAYCYINRITKGTSKVEFSPEAQMPADEYITLVLRSLGYKNVQPDNAGIAAAEYSLADSNIVKNLLENNFTRDNMVFISYRALMVHSLSGETLAQRLIENGTITQRMAKHFNLLPKNQYWEA